MSKSLRQEDFTKLYMMLGGCILLAAGLAEREEQAERELEIGIGIWASSYSMI